MAKIFGYSCGPKNCARAWVILLAVLVVPARPAHPGDAPEGDVQRHGRKVSLSIRIAQAEGNERKVRKYKSLARQHKERRSLGPRRPANPGTRASRPGRTP